MISLQVGAYSINGPLILITVLQAVTAPPSSISIADMLDSSIDKYRPTTFVNIGLQNGVLLRTVLDPTNGKLADTRTRCVSGPFDAENAY